VGTSETVPFLVSDFVDGVTLADWLTPTAHFAEAAELILPGWPIPSTTPTKRAWCTVDVKPSNVMLERVTVGQRVLSSRSHTALNTRTD